MQFIFLAFNLESYKYFTTKNKIEFKKEIKTHLKNYLFFNWRINALQNFAVFCHTSTWISHRYTYVLSLLNLPPISLPIPPFLVDTEPLFEFPETYSKFPLAVYFTYGNLSFHVTLSIHLTLSSCLPMSVSLFSVSVSPLLPWKEILWHYLSRLHIYALVYDILGKAMAPHSSTLAWKIPWMEEPGRLRSMWSLRVRHDWVTSLSLFTFTHWRKKWQPTPVFLPGESWGQGSLVGCRLWGRTESDTTDVT